MLLRSCSGPKESDKSIVQNQIWICQYSVLQTETDFGLLKQKMNIWQGYLSAHRTDRMSVEPGLENKNTGIFV